MKPSISFLIASYNVENFLTKSVSSVLRQKNPRCDLEVIIVDNKSTDNTFKVAKELQSENPNIIKAFQNPENRGIAYSINRCWEKSKSEFTILLHSDNELLDGALNLFLDYIESGNYQHGIVFGDIVYIDVCDKVIGSWSGEHLGAGHLSNKHLIENYIDKNGSRVRPLQFLLDRKSFEEIGPYSEDYFCDDWEFTIRYLCHTDIHRINAPLFKFRDRPDSAGHKPETYADSLMDVIEEHEHLLYEKFNLSPKTIYTNTLCRIIIMFIHKYENKIALKKFFFYKKKYLYKIKTSEVVVFFLLVYTKLQLKRLLRLTH